MKRFFLLGDWGALTESQRKVANRMKELMLKNPGDFDSVFALGDNFYEYGVTSSTSVQWDETWKRAFSTELRQIPWRAILGNHDHYSGFDNAKKQIQRYYEHIQDDVWYLPDFNYTLSYSIPSGNRIRNVHFVFIDTQLLVPSKETSDLDTSTQLLLRDSQLKWLNETLFSYRNGPKDIKTLNPYIIVIGHYPVYSIGEHGDSKELAAHLEPLMAKYGVSLYISAHDHISAYIRRGSMDHMVVGAGSQPKAARLNPEIHHVDRITSSRLFNSKYDYNVLWYRDRCAGFAELKITSDGIQSIFYDSDGAIMYTPSMILYSDGFGSWGERHSVRTGVEGHNNNDLYRNQHSFFIFSFLIIIVMFLVIKFKK